MAVAPINGRQDDDILKNVLDDTDAVMCQAFPVHGTAALGDRTSHQVIQLALVAIAYERLINNRIRAIVVSSAYSKMSLTTWTPSVAKPSQFTAPLPAVTERAIRSYSSRLWPSLAERSCQTRRRLSGAKKTHSKMSSAT